MRLSKGLAPALAPILTAAGLTTMIGIAYIADCRFSKGASFDSCWMTGASLMGIGGGGAAGAAAGFRAGFNTYNPDLRRKDQP